MRANELLVMIASLGLFACGSTEIKPDSASGKDFERAGAQQLFLDKLQDDYISANEGDNTDWKFFKVQEKGFLKLTVFWDDHKDVKSVIDIRDRFGALLDSRRHSSELEKDVIDLRVEPGTHFVRLNTGKGKSVYTIEAVFQPFDYEPGGGDDARPIAVSGSDLLGEGVPDDIRPDVAPADDARPRTRRTRPRRTTPRRTRTRTKTGGGGGDAGPTLSGRTVSATITRIVSGPRKKGAFLTINRGSKDGIISGAKGCILKASGGCFANVIVKKVGQSGAKAFTIARPNEIADRRRVKISVQ